MTQPIPHGPLQVLVVEDHAACRTALTTLLELEGASVSATGSGLEAAVLAREQAFDVILTDLGLPDVPGSCLIREIAATARGHPHVAVISGAAESDILEAYQAGAELVFRKPFDWEAIAGYLRRACPTG